MPETYTITTREVIQVFPANGAKAVFWDDSDPENLILYTLDCHFLGLATVTEKTYIKATYGQDYPSDEEPIRYNEIVAIDISDGYMQLFDEDSNFAGIAMPRQHIYKCLGKMPFKLRDKVKRLPPEAHCSEPA